MKDRVRYTVANSSPPIVMAVRCERLRLGRRSGRAGHDAARAELLGVVQGSSRGRGNNSLRSAFLFSSHFLYPGASVVPRSVCGRHVTARGCLACGHGVWEVIGRDGTPFIGSDAVRSISEAGPCCRTPSSIQMTQGGGGTHEMACSYSCARLQYVQNACPT